MNILPCPECGDPPHPVDMYFEYLVSCQCHDPTPTHSGDGLTAAPYSGSGATEKEAIQNWNESVEEAR